MILKAAIPAVVALLAMPGAPAGAQTPAGDCLKSVPAGVRMVCETPELTELHNRLTMTMARASARAGPNERKALARAHRDWLASRDACAGSAQKKRCLEDAYSSRIVSLELSSGLADSKGPFPFTCGVGQTAWVTFGATYIPSARMQSSDYDLILFARADAEERAAGDEIIFENNEFRLLTVAGKLLLSGNDGELWCDIGH
ncbi:MAG: lysozyme inhibitor LprI family protein [Hyphomicrobiales bacterium]